MTNIFAEIHTTTNLIFFINNDLENVAVNNETTFSSVANQFIMKNASKLPS